MTELRIATLAILSTLMTYGCAASEPTEPVLSAAAQTRSGAAPDTTSCRSKEDAWLARRRTAPTYPAQLASLQSIGDCWVAAGDIERARAFYHTVKTEFRERVCDREGVACPVLATEELRRVDCAGGWVTSSAEIAWRDFLGALDHNDGDPKALRVSPDVRSETARADPSSEACGAAFTIPKSVRAEREQIRRSVMSSTRPWNERSVAVAIRPEDVPWKNYAPGVYHAFRLRACPTTRPVAGQPMRGYYVQIAPVESETIDPPCASN